MKKNKIFLKTKKELQIIRANGKLHRKIMTGLIDYVSAGISTWDLEVKARKLMKQHEVQPVQIGYMGYPCAICAGINDDSVHTIPNKKKIVKDGDIITIDFSMKKDGFCVDAGLSIPIGNVDKIGMKIINTAKMAFLSGFQNAIIGNRTGDISNAIYNTVSTNGFDVLTQFVAHGIGKEMHEQPSIYNYGRKNSGEQLVSGMVIALDTMVTEGKGEVKILEDGWSTKTKDGKRFAFYEHTFIVTDDGPEIVT